MRFRDRADAGRRLGEVLAAQHFESPMVLALPRGGVPVAFEIAERLDAPLEVFVVRKLGAPAHPEYGIGAIAEDGGRVIDEQAVQLLGLSEADLAALVAREQVELERRVDHYRGDRPRPEVTGRDVILVDDGLATGVSALAALQALRRRSPRRLVLAVPACAPSSPERLLPFADDVVCLIQPKQFRAVGQWYDDFSQTTDDQVIDLLAKHRARIPRA